MHRHKAGLTLTLLATLGVSSVSSHAQAHPPQALGLATLGQPRARVVRLIRLPEPLVFAVAPPLYSARSLLSRQAFFKRALNGTSHVVFQSVVASKRPKWPKKNFLRLHPKARAKLRAMGYVSVEITDEIRTPLKPGQQKPFALRFQGRPKKTLHTSIKSVRPLRIQVEIRKEKFQVVTKHKGGAAYVVFFGKKEIEPARLLIVSPQLLPKAQKKRR